MATITDLQFSIVHQTYFEIGGLVSFDDGSSQNVDYKIDLGSFDNCEQLLNSINDYFSANSDTFISDFNSSYEPNFYSQCNDYVMQVVALESLSNASDVANSSNLISNELNATNLSLETSNSLLADILAKDASISADGVDLDNLNSGVVSISTSLFVLIALCCLGIGVLLGHIFMRRMV